MLVSNLRFLSTLLASTSFVIAQTYTTCNPLQQTCPSNPGSQANSISTDFTKGSSADWTIINGTTASYTSSGATFTINNKTDSPTLGTSFYLLFGSVSVTMKAAPGVGIVSAIVLESDDLDEIDWEILGGSPDNAQSNYFGKGDTTTYNRGQTHAVSASTTTFHTYTINWTSSAIAWSIDGTTVRTLTAAAAGTFFPQTPCQVRIGNWPAGASPNAGTVSWAGGPTDFSKAPFNMYVSSVSIVNYNPATSYTYSDRSGTWQSIKISGGSAVVGNNAKILASAAQQNTTTTSSTASSSASTASAGTISTAKSSNSSTATASAAATSASAHSSSGASTLTPASGTGIVLSILLWIVGLKL